MTDEEAENAFVELKRKVIEEVTKVDTTLITAYMDSMRPAYYTLRMRMSTDEALEILSNRMLAIFDLQRVPFEKMCREARQAFDSIRASMSSEEMKSSVKEEDLKKHMDSVKDEVRG